MPMRYILKPTCRRFDLEDDTAEHIIFLPTGGIWCSHYRFCHSREALIKNSPKIHRSVRLVGKKKGMSNELNLRPKDKNRLSSFSVHLYKQIIHHTCHKNTSMQANHHESDSLQIYLQNCTNIQTQCRTPTSKLHFDRMNMKMKIRK